MTSSCMPRIFCFGTRRLCTFFSENADNCLLFDQSRPRVKITDVSACVDCTDSALSVGRRTNNFNGPGRIGSELVRMHTLAAQYAITEPPEQHEYLKLHKLAERLTARGSRLCTTLETREPPSAVGLSYSRVRFCSDVEALLRNRQNT